MNDYFMDLEKIFAKSVGVGKKANEYKKQTKEE